MKKREIEYGSGIVNHLHMSRECLVWQDGPEAENKKASETLKTENGTPERLPEGAEPPDGPTDAANAASNDPAFEKFNPQGFKDGPPKAHEDCPDTRGSHLTSVNQITQGFEQVHISDMPMLTPDRAVGRYLKQGFIEMPSPTKDKSIISSKLKSHRQGGIGTDAVKVATLADVLENNPAAERVRGYENLSHPPRTARAAMILKDPRTLTMAELREFDEARGKRHYKDRFAAKITQEIGKDMKLLVARISKLEERQEDFCEDLENISKAQ